MKFASNKARERGIRNKEKRKGSGCTLGFLNKLLSKGSIVW